VNSFQPEESAVMSFTSETPLRCWGVFTRAQPRIGNG
jgi:hypothetical protein